MKIDLSQATFIIPIRIESSDRLKRLKEIESVALSRPYDRHTRMVLETLLKEKFPIFKGKSIANFIKNGQVLEVMAGWGRNVPIYQKFGAAVIEILDASKDMIALARQ